MDIILIPGLWLDASTWDDVVPRLQAAGHRTHALTMPGVGEPASDIGMAEWIDHVVDHVDAIGGSVMVVGHSGGGNVAWGAANARPDRVARVVFVDTVPPATGHGISEFAVVDGVVPFPGWDFFPEEDVWDLDAATRERTAPLTKSVPARVPSDPIELDDDRRFDVPVTLLMGGYDRAELDAEMAKWGEYGAEYFAIKDVTVARIGTAHWPQLTAPDRLADLILAAAEM